MEADSSQPKQGIKVKVQSTKAARDKLKPEELYAQVCYHYPQYTLETAAQLSYRRIHLLLKTVAKIQAAQNYNLTQIAAAPHTKRGSGVKKLTEYFKKIANS